MRTIFTRISLSTAAKAGATLATSLLSACSDPTEGLRSPDGGTPSDVIRGDAQSEGAPPVDGGPATGHVVMSQIYGGGGGADAPFTHDFVELFNGRTESVALGGWSLQYASASGTGNFGATDAQLSALPHVSVKPGQYYLVQLAQGTGSGAPLPAADFVDPTPINMSATGGKIALVKATMPLGCNGGSVPCAPAMLESLVDWVGYGGANFFEGSGPAPATSNVTAAFRAAGGCVDTDDNAADFVTLMPAPRNTQSPLRDCSRVDAGFPPRDGSADGALADVAPADAVRGLRIRDIQGRAHLSPLRGTSAAAVSGIVTAVGGAGFFLQDPLPDADDATSEGIYVFTSSAPGVAPGDAVSVSGAVDEFRPGCAAGCAATSSAYANLTTTQIRLPTSVVVLSTGNALPAPVVIGPNAGERRVPNAVIDDDSSGNVEVNSTTFDPDLDGIDFYESLEGMRVAVIDAVAVGPTSAFSSGSREIPILPNAGAGAGLRTARGGILISPTDYNPERIVLANTLVRESPDVNVGDRFAGTIVGVIDYAFAKYNLVATEALPAVAAGPLVRETLALPDRTDGDLDMASFNVENLDPGDPSEKFGRLADIVVKNLNLPDLLALEEIQDNSGATDDGTVDASRTFTMLADAIRAAGGPSYQFRNVDPENGKDGGEAGGNIRTGFLFRTDRGLSFLDRPGAAFDTPNAVVIAGNGKPTLRFSPGRIDPAHGAFSSSRKPLVGEFTYRGRTLFIIANHFNSKGGDQPLFGRFQPPTLSSEAQRLQQAQIVAAFVSEILAVDAGAAIAVVGDLNDFEFSPPLMALKSARLTALVETLLPNERYSYVYEGNAQTLDHFLVSAGLLSHKTGFDVVHVNAEFFDQASDHDPSVARFSMPTQRLLRPDTRIRHP